MSPTEPPQAVPFHIAIVGGGIAGLITAIGILRYNIPITIYEAAAHFGEIGAGVSIGPNAGRALELISPDVARAFDICRTDNQWESHRRNFFTCRVGDARKADKDGFVKPGVKVGDALFTTPFKVEGKSGGVHRAHFLDELVKQVPDGVAKFGKRLDKYSEAEDGSGDVVLHFHDGTTAQHTAVIACDGIKSRSREILLGKDDPAASAVFSGKYCYRGLIPMEEATALLGEEVAANSNMFFGYHGHMLTFPIEKGKTMNVVAFASKEQWEDSKWVVSTTKEEMVADFDGWGSHVHKILKAIQKPDIWALFYHPRCHTFYKGRICLLGDAAHATTPHHGAGAGMCIEDALIMSCLANEAKSVQDLEKAFTAFDEVRRPRSQKNVIESKQAGMLYDFELEGDDLDKVEKNFTTRMDWIWGFDIVAQVEEAKKLFHEVKAKI
ncbi:salicylate hydroxylase-like protein [Amniculicola lignicola CBS 123094]|uniref:Salicylate hydroxylase-like protein n=1 Tax=Amniculicola lignicola CBS 123094 TaxID=1392246 RepID=A0A6A5VWP7_9PLEO|nr:salicylate hydroxylase-like protein [Amniculicola lignicola CBS 123094]